MNKSQWTSCAVTIVFALTIVLFKAPSVYADKYDELNKSWAGIPKSGSCGPEATYTVKGNVLTISGKGEVTKPFDNVFGHFIQKVVIQDGITSVCDYNLVGAYLNNESEYMLMNIEDYYVPLSVTKIEPYTIGYYWNEGVDLLSVNVRIHTSKRANEAIRYANANGFNLVYDYPETIDINTCTVSGISSVVYTGAPRTQNIKVEAGLTVLNPGTDYTVSYANNINAGVATVIISGKGDYSGTVTKTFEIVKAMNPMTVKGKTVSVKYGKLKKRSKRYRLNQY